MVGWDYEKMVNINRFMATGKVLFSFSSLSLLAVLVTWKGMLDRGLA
jgi:hypothetical protein